MQVIGDIHMIRFYGVELWSQSSDEVFENRNTTYYLNVTSNEATILVKE